MRSGVKLVLVTALTLAAGAGAVRLGEILPELELFRVRDLTVQGARYLTRAEAVATLALRADAGVWDDPAPLEARLARHPLVKRARVRRRPPSTLVVEVEERRPVALVPTPTLEPVDAEGRLLPIDPARHRLDLPVVRLPGAPPRREGAGAPRGWAPARVRPLAGELARLASQDPSFVRELSVLEGRGDDLEAVWGDRGIHLLFHAPLTPLRLREARGALADAARRFPDRAVRAVDVRFADQVVVRFGGEG